MRLITAVLFAAAAVESSACKFPPPADVPDVDPDARTQDARSDGAPGCTPSARGCVAGRYSECDASGRYVEYEVPNGAGDGSPTTLVMNEYECPLGCHNSEPRCLDVDASNGLNAALDAVAVSPTGVDVLIDDPTGAATALLMHDRANPTVNIAQANGATVTVPGLVIAQPGGHDIHVLLVRSFTLRAGSRLKFVAVKPIAIVSHFDVHIAGTLDYAGVGNTGLAQHPGCDTRRPAWRPRAYRAIMISRRPRCRARHVPTAPQPAELAAPSVRCQEVEPALATPWLAAEDPSAAPWLARKRRSSRRQAR
jgi:hypothetical protein